MEIVEHEDINEIISDVDVLYVTRIQRERFPDSASYFNVTSNYRITRNSSAAHKSTSLFSILSPGWMR